MTAGDEQETTTLRVGAPRVEPRPVAPRSLSTTPGVEDEQARVEVQEHVANVLRFRIAMLAAVLIVPGFGLLDLLVDRMIQPGVLVYFLSIRAVVFFNSVGISAWLRYGSLPTRTQLYLAESYSWGLGSLMIGLMCAEYGGLESDYAPGFIIVLGVAGAATVDRWRRGLVRLLSVLLTGPVTLVVLVALDPASRTQLSDPRTLAIFAQSMTFLVGMFGLSLLGSHTMWTLRRQVFASRDIGRYRLDQKLGQGGMGEVWSAHHSGLRRNVAVKLLRSDDARPDLVNRFEREVSALSDLKHPNTVRVFDYGVTEDGIWYYAMELLEGEDLGKLRKRAGRLPPHRAVRIVRQAARALGEAHARGIVHRDIKPENLFITKIEGEDDFVKVLDFGIAKRSESASQLTQTGMIAGTPAFISPEAARGKPSDARSDVYALGVVLFDALAGGLPFETSNASEMLFAHAEIAPPDLRERVPEVSEELAGVVARCLAKSPEDRYANGNELADALDALASKLSA